MGESTLAPVAPAIANAIEDAAGVRVTSLPITAGSFYTCYDAIEPEELPSETAVYIRRTALGQLGL